MRYILYKIDSEKFLKVIRTQQNLYRTEIIVEPHLPEHAAELEITLEYLHWLHTRNIEDLQDYGIVPVTDDFTEWLWPAMIPALEAMDTLYEMENGDV